MNRAQTEEVPDNRFQGLDLESGDDWTDYLECLCCPESELAIFTGWAVYFNGPNFRLREVIS